MGNKSVSYSALMPNVLLT